MGIIYTGEIVNFIFAVAQSYTTVEEEYLLRDFFSSFLLWVAKHQVLRDDFYIYNYSLSNTTYIVIKSSNKYMLACH